MFKFANYTNNKSYDFWEKDAKKVYNQFQNMTACLGFNYIMSCDVILDSEHEYDVFINIVVQNSGYEIKSSYKLFDYFGNDLGTFWCIIKSNLLDDVYRLIKYINRKNKKPLT